MNRRDAWKTEEDTLLLQTVISYISSGKTQLEAFNSVARKLNRSAAGVGFRWNGKLRASFEDRIREAKKQRSLLSVKRKKMDNDENEMDTNLINSIICDLTCLNDKYQQMIQLEEELKVKIDRIDQEIKEIKEISMNIPRDHIDLENIKALKKIILKTTELLGKETEKTAM